MVPAVVEVCSEATQDWASKTLGAMQLKRAEWIPSGEDAWDLFVNYGKGLTLEAGANENAPLPIRRHFQVNYPRTKADVKYVHPASSMKHNSETYVRQVQPLT